MSALWQPGCHVSSTALPFLPRPLLPAMTQHMALLPGPCPPTGGSPEAIFMLAPLLLLLSQDPLLLTGLEDRMRYFPPVLAVTAFLTTTAVVEVRLGGTTLGIGCGTSCNRQPNVASDLALRHTP